MSAAPITTDGLHGAAVDLRGRVAVVTGGSSGIGLAVVRELGRRGVRVAVAGRDAERVASAAASVPEGLGVAGCDVRERSSIESLFDQTVARFGAVDILVTSAGLGASPRSRKGLPLALMHLSREEWDDVVDTNLRGAFLACQVAARQMRDQGTGQILNISSAPAARRGYAYAASYCASKHALNTFSQSLVEELEPLGIRVITMLPDMVDTPMVQGTQLTVGGLLRPESVGAFVVDCLAQPWDVRFDQPVMLPLAAGSYQQKGH